MWKLTDLNPRWVGPQALPTRAGIDFPLMHYLDVIGERPPAQMEFEDGVRWLNGINDLASRWWHYRHGLLKPWDWIRSYGAVRAHSSFSWDDPAPMFKEYDYGLKLLKVPVNMFRQRQ